MNAFTTTPRQDLTAQQRARFFYERGGHCEICGIRIRAGTKWEIDHKEALENGGTNEPENLQLACAICHAAKTPLDRAKAAKTRRVATKGIVPERHRQKSMLSKREGWKFNWKARRYEKEETAE